VSGFACDPRGIPRATAASEVGLARMGAMRTSLKAKGASLFFATMDESGGWSGSPSYL